MKFTVVMLGGKKVDVVREVDTKEEVYELVKDIMVVVKKVFVVDNTINKVVYRYCKGIDTIVKNRNKFILESLGDMTAIEKSYLNHAKNNTLATCFAKMRNVSARFVDDLLEEN